MMAHPFHGGCRGQDGTRFWVKYQATLRDVTMVSTARRVVRL
jgi:hypothetical protein